MRFNRTFAGLLATSVVMGAALVAVAGPAAANDEGTELPGGIYWFDNFNPLALQSAATQISSGANAATGGPLANGRPWATLTTENPCPAGTVIMESIIRIPQVGEVENNWVQVPVGAAATATDADGRFYTTTASMADRLSKAQVTNYNLANPGANTFPFISVCRDVGGFSLGYFRTAITISGTTAAALTWSIPLSPLPGGGGAEAVATTTTLTASAAGPELALTATVSPAAAAGEVTFMEGATALGTVIVVGGTATATVTAPAHGSHTYTADFAPTDPAAYVASQATLTVTLALDGTNGQLLLGVPAAPVVDGALTFSVPFDSPVALTGTRDVANTRVVASGTFPTVTVTDTRRDGLLSGWEVNAQASDFAGTAGTVGAKYLGWTPATPVMTKDAGSPLVAQAGPAVASFLDSATSAGLSASSLLGKAATPGRGITALDAALALAIPGTTAEGSYTSTVTVTLVGG